jgi:pimeloyl-ACP methyl ester carboxylesterase
MTRILAVLFAACALAQAPAVAQAASQPAPGRECVVLLHGMGRTHLYMGGIEEDLEQAGYLVVNESIPSRRRRIEQLAPLVKGFIDQCRAQGATRIHFVTHSLGSIVVRYYLRDHPLPDAGRFVMLGPPNRGSEVTDKYRDSWWYRLSTGPAGQQIGTGADSVPNQLGAAPLETAVIAGTRASNPAFNDLFGGPNDGKVSVARTRIPGLVDFLQVDSSHDYLTRSAEVMRQVRAFLATGHFERKS